MKRTFQQFITRLAIAATTLAVAIGPGAVHAQSTASLGTRLTPPSFDMTLSPGESITKTIEIQNNSGVTQTYNLSVNGFTAAGEEGASAFLPANGNDLSGWIAFSPPQSISVPANGTRNVDVTITVPQNAAPGGHYATIFARTDSATNDTTTGVGVQQMIGVNFLVRVAGNVIENATVVEFSTPKSRLEPGEELMFTSRVRNTGNVHIRPSGVIEIYRGNAKIHEIPLNEAGGNVLPDSVRRFTVTSDKYLPAGKYRAGLVLQYGASQVIQVPPVEFVVVNENLFVMVVIASLIILAIILIIALVVNRKGPSEPMMMKKK